MSPRRLAPYAGDVDFLFSVLVFVHFIGWAMVLGGYFASIRGAGLYRGVFHGAATAAVAGVVMLGLVEAGSVDFGGDVGKLRVKLLVAVVIAVLGFFARRQGAKADNGTGAVTPALKHAIGALTVLNVILAVFW